MRLPKNHGVTDPELIRNAKSVQREKKCDFKLSRHARIVKDSATYRMLKYGPVPVGDHSYLIEDGRPTKYARWLIIAADLEMSWHTLAMLTRVTDAHLEIRGRMNILRETLDASLAGQYDEDEGKRSLKILTSRGYITRIPNSSLQIHDHRILEFLDHVGEDYYSLGRFIYEKIMWDEYPEKRRRSQSITFHLDMMALKDWEARQ